MEFLVETLERLNLWAWWAISGVILMGELLTGTTFFLWPAAAAFLTGIISIEAIGLEWPLQLGVFAFLSLVLVWVGDRWLRPKLKIGADSGLNARGDRMIGQRVVVASGFTAGQGRVRYGDTEWSAEMADGSNPEDGAQLEVLEVNGNTLRVKAA